jgi:hypothetical protein
MSLSPIIGAATQVLNLFGSSSSTSGSPGSSTTSPVDSSGSVDLSQAAQFFSKLQNLAETNSTQFKQLTAQIASQLQADAQNATGSEQSFLTNLSNQFSTASQTGSASALQPQAAQTGGHHSHHGHHHSSTQTAYDQSVGTADSSSGSSSVLQSVFQQVQSL